MPAPTDESVASLQAAAELLALAMSESNGPVDVLGRSFERMARAIAECSRTIERQRTLENGHREAGAHAPLADFEACQAVLEREIAVCIESLQFHDRLMQRLSRVSDSLASRAGPGGRVRGRRASASEGSIELF